MVVRLAVGHVMPSAHNAASAVLTAVAVEKCPPVNRVVTAGRIRA